MSMCKRCHTDPELERKTILAYALLVFLPTNNNCFYLINTKDYIYDDVLTTSLDIFI